MDWIPDQVENDEGESLTAVPVFRYTNPCICVWLSSRNS